METTLLYQSRLSLPTVRPTPESADSTGKGARIDPCKFSGTWSPPIGRMLYCQSPFNEVHAFRTICGRGYAVCGAEAFTSADQRVAIFPSTICQDCCDLADKKHKQQKKHAADVECCIREQVKDTFSNHFGAVEFLILSCNKLFNDRSQTIEHYARSARKLTF